MCVGVGHELFEGEVLGGGLARQTGLPVHKHSAEQHTHQQGVQTPRDHVLPAPQHQHAILPTAAATAGTNKQVIVFEEQTCMMQQKPIEPDPLIRVHMAASVP